MNQEWGSTIGAVVLALSFVVIPSVRPREQVDPKDQGFVNKASESNMAEVKLGRLAEEKGTNRAVKSFGRRMVDDNIKNARQMRTIVPQQSLTTVSGLDKADQNIYEQLSKLSGRDFDRAYARDTVRADAEILTEYLRESMVGENAAVKTYAVRSLPKLDKHLVMARKMQKAVNRKAHDSENRPASAAKGRNYSEPAT